jgi:two-component system chemotaxis response regulator CheB
MTTRIRDLVTIAASAGGVTALQRLFATLPADLPAALLVVMHLPASGGSSLARVLGRSSRLPVDFATDGQRPEPGRVLVAPPNRHLMLDGDLLRLSPAPRQKGVRPAADPLFFSAAVARGPGVIGVVLSGALDDGSAGCAAIEEAGGLVAVQDLAEAGYEGMPRAAIALTRDAFVADVEEIAAYLGRQTRLSVQEGRGALAPEIERRVQELLHPPVTAEDVPPGPIPGRREW